MVYNRVILDKKNMKMNFRESKGWEAFETSLLLIKPLHKTPPLTNLRGGGGSGPPVPPSGSALGLSLIKVSQIDVDRSIGRQPHLSFLLIFQKLHLCPQNNHFAHFWFSAKMSQWTTWVWGMIFSVAVLGMVVFWCRLTGLLGNCLIRLTGRYL